MRSSVTVRELTETGHGPRMSVVDLATEGKKQTNLASAFIRLFLGAVKPHMQLPDYANSRFVSSWYPPIIGAIFTITIACTHTQLIAHS